MPCSGLRKPTVGRRPAPGALQFQPGALLGAARSRPWHVPVSQARSSEPRGAVHGASLATGHAFRSRAEPTPARSRQSGALLGAARSRPRCVPGNQARALEPRAAVPGALPSVRRAPQSRAEPTPSASPTTRHAPRCRAQPNQARPRQPGALLGAAGSRPRRAPGGLREADQICAARPLFPSGFPGAPGLRGFSPAAAAVALVGPRGPGTRPQGRALR